MADAFVLPADLSLSLSDGGFSLDHPGDVTLGQTLGLPISRVKSGGDLTLDCGTVNGTVYADGVLTINGDVDADTLFGRVVVLNSESINARAISATERIIIGSAKMRVDILIAPEIELDKQARGRVTVIECHGDLPPSRIRGGYSLEEYEEDFGDSAGFLRERGVSPLGQAATAPAPMPVTEDFGDFADDDLTEDVSAPEELSESDHDEDVSDPISITNLDLTPLDDDEDDLHPKLTEALERIVNCYDDELPPPVASLQGFIGSRDYDALRTNITDVWTGLLGYHQQKGIRPHHQVTHAFNVIHGLVSDS